MNNIPARLFIVKDIYIYMYAEYYIKLYSRHNTLSNSNRNVNGDTFCKTNNTRVTGNPTRPRK